MAEWKMILDSEKRKVKNPRTKETATKEIFTIITNDKYQLVVGEWVKDEDGNLEINSERYRQFNANSTYHKNYGQAIESYLNTKEISPDQDLVTIMDIEKHYRKLIEEGKRLFNLHDRLDGVD